MATTVSAALARLLIAHLTPIQKGEAKRAVVSTLSVL